MDIIRKRKFFMKTRTFLGKGKLCQGINQSIILYVCWRVGRDFLEGKPRNLCLSSHTSKSLGTDAVGCMEPLLYTDRDTHTRRENRFEARNGKSNMVYGIFCQCTMDGVLCCVLGEKHEASVRNPRDMSCHALIIHCHCDLKSQMDR